MKNKKGLFILILILIIISLSILFLAYEYSEYSRYTASLIATNTNKQVSLSLPIKIVIPKINIISNVESVGLTLDKIIDSPINPDNVAWYNLSPRPGEKGNSIIVGHSGWFNKRPVVFDNLHKLNIGNKIYIVNEKEEPTIFIVKKIKTFDENENTSEIFNSNDGGVHLNLITCGGIWNPSDQTYSQRLVVFTDKF